MTQPYVGDPDWPSAFGGCRFIGTFVDFLARPVSGKISVTPTISIIKSGGRIIVATTLTFDLDSTGSVDFIVPATNDADTSPVGWKYKFTENFTGLPGRTYQLDAPVGTTVNLVDVTSGG